MPAIVALAIRALIQMAITLGLLELAERYVLPLINRAIEEVMEFFGVAEDTAQDIMANEVLQFAESVGIGALVLRAKIPTKIAERLGFTSKGWSKRLIKTKGATVAERAGKAGIILPGQEAGAAAKVAETIAKTGKTTLAKANEVATLLIKVFGIPIGLGVVLTNTLDFGTWNASAYQETFQKLFAVFGLHPDKKYTKPTIISEEMFAKAFLIFEQQGATTINDPFKKTEVPFNRTNLVNLTDGLVGPIILERGKATIKDVLTAALPFIIFGKPAVSMTVGLEVNANTKTYTTPTKAIIPQIKVFTGVVTAGVLSETEPVLAREDDLIENAAELELGAVANLVPFIKALPGRVAYQIKITASVADKRGFRREGGEQRVITGYLKNGQPKYKTIRNKWAVMDLFAFTARGARTKLDTIILGPVNSAVFNPSENEIANMGNRLKDNILAKSFAEVTVMRTEYPLTVQFAPAGGAAPAPAVLTIPKEATAGTIQQPVAAQLAAAMPAPTPTAPPAAPAAPTPAAPSATTITPAADEWMEFMFVAKNYMHRVKKSRAASDPFGVRRELIDLLRQGLATEENVDYVLNTLNMPLNKPYIPAGPAAAQPWPTPAPAAAPAPAAPIQLGEYVPSPEYLRLYSESEIIRHTDGKIYLRPGVPVRWSAPATPTVSAPAPTPAGPVRIWASSNPEPCGASSIATYFDPAGKSYPSVSERAKWYEQFGLGSSALYTGTAEQNAKLLAAIKRQECGF